MPFKIAIINQPMQIRNGLKLGIDIRNNHSLDETKLLILSSFGRKDDAGQFKKAGFSAYLNKLNRYDTVKNMIAAILQHHDSQPLLNQHSIEQAQTKKKLSQSCV